MASELPDGWYWKDIYGGDHLDLMTPDDEGGWIENTQGDGWVVGPFMWTHGDQVSAEDALIASVYAMRGELPPAVRDVLERARDLIIDQAIELDAVPVTDNGRARAFVREIDALLKPGANHAD